MSESATLELISVKKTNLSKYLPYTVTMEFQGFHLVDAKYQEIQPTTDGRLWESAVRTLFGSL